MKPKPAKKKPAENCSLVNVRNKGKLVYFTDLEMEFLRKQAAADRRDVNSFIRVKCLEGFKE
jgi:hypothetical protein